MSTTTARAASKPFLTLTAADLMSTPVMTIPQYMLLREAALMLSRSSMSGAPVVDENGRAIGVLSSSDFVTWAGKGGEEISFIAPWGELIRIEDAADTELRRYMTAKPVTVPPTDPIGKLAQMMVDAHIHRVLVVSEGYPRGIVTSTDIVAAVARAARKASYESEGKPRPRSRARHQ
jgi:CBS-domain-containing membrane protein